MAQRVLLICSLVRSFLWMGMNTFLLLSCKNSVNNTSLALSPYFSIPTLADIWFKRTPVRWCCRATGLLSCKNSATILSRECLELRMLYISGSGGCSLGCTIDWNRQIPPLYCSANDERLIALELSSLPVYAAAKKVDLLDISGLSCSYDGSAEDIIAALKLTGGSC